MSYESPQKKSGPMLTRNKNPHKPDTKPDGTQPLRGKPGQLSSGYAPKVELEELKNASKNKITKGKLP